MSTTDYIPPPREIQFYPAPLTPELLNGGSRWVLEIGPGKGEFILDQAQTRPEFNFIAVELKRGRFEKIAKQAGQLELTNLYLARGDARECLPRLFPKGLFEEIYILFPDPWPKKRHIKHRLLKPRMVHQLRELLNDQGEIYCATDAGYYAEQIDEAFAEAGGFQCQQIESMFPTYFEKKWKKLGRKIAYWKFTKVNNQANYLLSNPSA